VWLGLQRSRSATVGHEADDIASDMTKQASQIMDYVEDVKPVFSEFRRVARRGATLVFSMAHPMRDWMDELLKFRRFREQQRSRSRMMFIRPGDSNVADPICISPDHSLDRHLSCRSARTERLL
jgi:hypothetical protein